MKIFIIGYTGSGKSTFARLLSEQLENSETFEAGRWAREMFPDCDTEELTQKAMDYLKEEPFHSLNCLRDRLNESRAEYKLVVGIRNPIDFVHLYNPNYDIVFAVTAMNREPKTVFEEYGLNAIMEYGQFLLVTDIMSSPYYLVDGTESVVEIAEKVRACYQTTQI